jgi:GTP-binding protein
MSRLPAPPSGASESGAPAPDGPEPDAPESEGGPPGAARGPVVAIVGRANVGKSTLFNRLVGRRQAIVHNQPGVTRDRVTGRAELGGKPCVLIDTGGLMPDGDVLGLNAQVELAIEESDLLLLVVDGKEGLTVADEHVWESLRPRGKPTLLVVNKADTRVAREGAAEFSRLGLGEWHLVSAEHGEGIEELVRSVAARLPEVESAPPPGDALALALVGRPNVGKSSILNRLLGERRVLVSPIPGTTRDPIDSLLELDGRRYLLIDTAGIRRRAKTSGAPEELAIMLARRQIERAEIAVLVIDASDGVTAGDLAIAGGIFELGRSAVVAVNKWDLVTPAVRETLEASWPRLDEVLASPRRVNVSAESGRGIAKLLPTVEEVRRAHRVELGTSEVNRLFERAVERHHAPAIKGRPWKLYYATQVNTAPPTFMVFANAALPRGSSYRRYLENVVRRELDLRGVPARLVVRRR